jgi:hypothetical protein
VVRASAALAPAGERRGDLALASLALASVDEQGPDLDPQSRDRLLPALALRCPLDGRHHLSMTAS